METKQVIIFDLDEMPENFISWYYKKYKEQCEISGIKYIPTAEEFVKKCKEENLKFLPSGRMINPVDLNTCNEVIKKQEIIDYLYDLFYIEIDYNYETKVYSFANKDDFTGDSNDVLRTYLIKEAISFEAPLPFNKSYEKELDSYIGNDKSHIILYPLTLFMLGYEDDFMSSIDSVVNNLNSKLK